MRTQTNFIDVDVDQAGDPAYFRGHGPHEYFGAGQSLYLRAVGEQVRVLRMATLMWTNVASELAHRPFGRVLYRRAIRRARSFVAETERIGMELVRTSDLRVLDTVRRRA